MDNERRKILAIMIAILAADKLAELPRDGEDVASREILYKATLNAEIILGMIDHRWPSERIAGRD